jgi:hypothetical protein
VKLKGSPSWTWGKKERKDYRYKIKHSLQIKEGETIEEILESTLTNHGLRLETLEVMIWRWKGEIDKVIHNMTIMMYYVLHAFCISLW